MSHIYDLVSLRRGALSLQLIWFKISILVFIIINNNPKIKNNKQGLELIRVWSLDFPRAISYSPQTPTVRRSIKKAFIELLKSRLALPID